MLGRILVVIGGILVVTLFAALLAPYFIDWTDFRKDFETQASRIIGKKVVVHGSVDARLLPFPSVTMTDVRVGEDESGEALVTAASFSMESELAPYLSGEALIYNMRIEEPKIRLRLTEDGVLDWVKTGNPQIPASAVILEKVIVSGGEIDFIDDQTGRNRKITNLDLNASAKTLAGPWTVSGTGAVDDSPGSFVMRTGTPEDGKLSLKLRLLPDAPGIVAELEGSLGLNGLRPQYAGKFRLRERFRSEAAEITETEAEPASAAPRVSGDFELENDRLRISQYEFQIGDPADPYIVKGEATLDAGRKPEFLLTAEGQQIDVTRFGSRNAEDKTDTTPIPLRDRIKAALTLIRDIPIPSMPGEARIRLPAVVAEDTTIRDVRLTMHPDGDGWRIDEAEAQLPGRTTLSAKGRLALGKAQSFTGDLLLASAQPTGFAEWITGEVPDAVRQLESAGFSATVDLTPDLQRFENLEIVLGDTQLKGRLERQAEADKPALLSADLRGNRFDVDTMVALGGMMTGENSVQMLFGHRLAARLDIGEFSGFGMKGNGLKASFTLADGAMSDIRVAFDDFYGSKVTASGGFAGLTIKPKGEASITLAAADMTDFLTLVSTRLPPHPALKRLADNASYFKNADLTLNLKLGLGDWPVEANLTGTANGSEVTADLAAQTLNLADSGGLTLSASIANPDTWLMFGQAGLQPLGFDADQDGRLALKLDQAPEGETQVSLNYTSTGTSASIEGQADMDPAHFLDGSYNVSVESQDIAPYLFMTGLALPGAAEGLPASMMGTIYLTPETLGVDSLSANIDGNDLTGTLSLDRTALRPQFEGEIDATSVDFGWLAAALLGPITDPVENALSSTPISKSTVLPIGLDLQLTARNFALGVLGDVTDFTGRIEVDQTKIALANATGAYGRGTFAGRAEIGNSEGTGFLRARLDVTGANLSTAFWKVGDAAAASAQSDFSLVVDTNGTTAEDMLQNATGSGALKLKDATIRGLNPAALTPLLAFADSVEGEIPENRLQEKVIETVLKSETTVSSLDIPFVISAGRLRASDIKAETDTLSIQAEADLDIPKATIDASATLLYKPGQDALAGAEPAITLNWEGPVATPERSVDLTALTGFLSLRRFEQERRRVDALQSRIAEQQRLRREAALFRYRASERERLRQQAEDEARLLKEAQDALKALAVKDEEERRKAEEEKRRQQEPNLDPALVQ